MYKEGKLRWNMLIFWNWPPKNIPDPQKRVAFQKPQKSAKSLHPINHVVRNLFHDFQTGFLQGILKWIRGLGSHLTPHVAWTLSSLCTDLQIGFFVGNFRNGSKSWGVIWRPTWWPGPSPGFPRPGCPPRYDLPLLHRVGRVSQHLTYPLHIFFLIIPSFFMLIFCLP